jgi:hypothetical protein
MVKVGLCPKSANRGGVERNAIGGTAKQDNRDVKNTVLAGKLESHI